jgi:hypothetical protein
MTALALPRELTETAGLPEIATEPVDICLVCGADEFAIIARGVDYELQTCANEWTFRQCTRCGHVQLDPRPAAATLEVIYPPHYYSYDMKRVSGALPWPAKPFSTGANSPAFSALSGDGRTPISILAAATSNISS